jgi:hypothetical protein
MPEKIQYGLFKLEAFNTKYKHNDDAGLTCSCGCNCACICAPSCSILPCGCIMTGMEE